MFAGLINSAIPFALFSWAVLHIATGLTSILNATVPLFGALDAAHRRDRPGPGEQRLGRSQCLGLALDYARPRDHE